MHWCDVLYSLQAWPYSGTRRLLLFRLWCHWCVYITRASKWLKHRYAHTLISKNVLAVLALKEIVSRDGYFLKTYKIIQNFSHVRWWFSNFLNRLPMWYLILNFLLLLLWNYLLIPKILPVTLFRCSEAAIFKWNSYRNPSVVLKYHIRSRIGHANLRKSTNNSKESRYRNYDAASWSILRINKGFHRSKQSKIFTFIFQKSKSLKNSGT